jgi:hypothetical protein
MRLFDMAQGEKYRIRDFSTGSDTMGLAKNEAELAARTAAYLKAELKRAGVTYEELVVRLREHGHPDETVASIKNKLARGTFPATFLLATAAALGLDCVELESI